MAKLHDSNIVVDFFKDAHEYDAIAYEAMLASLEKSAPVQVSRVDDCLLPPLILLAVCELAMAGKQDYLDDLSEALTRMSKTFSNNGAWHPLLHVVSCITIAFVDGREIAVHVPQVVFDVHGEIRRRHVH